jgi:uncharacterized protein
VKLVDLNILLYAVNRDSVPHRRAKAWVERTLSGHEAVALPWVVLLGFLRLTTSRRIMARPLSADQALHVVDGWLAQPAVVALAPGERHWTVLRDLLAGQGAAGDLTTDAHLAALAIEHGCELCSTDGDFSRFDGLRWTNPLAV